MHGLSIFDGEGEHMLGPQVRLVSVGLRPGMVSSFPPAMRVGAAAEAERYLQDQCVQVEAEAQELLGNANREVERSG